MLTVGCSPKPGGRGVPRRRALQVGLLGPLGLSLPAFARARAAAPQGEAGGSFGRARRCLLVFLNGGPSQLDLWDMKPHAPADVRGELQSIDTVVPGLRLSELLPLTSLHADKYKIVRSVTHEASVHTTAVYTMLTGTMHQTPTVDQLRITPQDHPHLGSIIAKYLAGRDLSSLKPQAPSLKPHVPPFACLPSLFQAPPVDGIWPGQNGGFLGRRFDPLVIPGDKGSARFKLSSIELPTEVSADRLSSRRTLLTQLDRTDRHAASRQQAFTHDECAAQAFELLGASRFGKATELAREPDRVHERYGRHLFGQGVLLARRLIEAELPLVTVYWNDPTPAGAGGGEYDSHGRIYHHMRNRLVPPTDRALSALFADLSERGMLDDTLVIVMGEFGRTPRLNKDAGRDHWPQVQSILLAGAGISGGAIYGASDRIGAFPAADPVTPPDLGQTILHLLGIPADFVIHDQQGQAFAASPGKVVAGLMA
jgi:Protein of unknown function (DUF1501)